MAKSSRRPRIGNRQTVAVQLASDALSLRRAM